jgi:HSP20 family molecular chaperone IbpA
LALPSEVDEGKISAAFTNGVLKIVVPKKEGAKSMARKIAIGSSKPSS